MSNDRAGDGKDNDKDRAVAKTAGFVVFSGIAMSILKALNPLNKPNLQCTHNNTNNGDQTEPVGGDSTQTDHKHQSFSLQEPTIKVNPISNSPINDMLSVFGCLRSSSFLFFFGLNYFKLVHQIFTFLVPTRVTVEIKTIGNKNFMTDVRANLRAPRVILGSKVND